MNKPESLREAIEYLYSILNKDRNNKLVLEFSEAKFIAATHHDIGRWIRNNWGLWEQKGRLYKWFKRKGIWHADDMSSIILTCFHRDYHKKPYNLKKQFDFFKDYWEKYKDD